MGESMRWIAIALLAGLAACAADTTGGKGVRDVEIVEAGIYAVPAGARSTPVGLCESLSLPNRTDVSISAQERTTRIPARLGTMFGVKFRPVGAMPDGVTNFRVLWRAPDPGIPDAVTGKPRRDDGCAYAYRMGVTTFQGFRFERPAELIPGAWALEIWHGDRKLLAYGFTVYKP
jgi:hypothetical protein